MKMLSRQHIAPRVVVSEARERRYTSKALSPTELKAVLSALKLTGIPDAAMRFSDDSARYALDQVLKEI